MPFPTRFTLCAAALLSPGAALAENAPYGGAVYNFKLNERINYSCSNVTDTDLECTFTKASVSPVLPADRIAALRADELKGIDEPGALESLAKGMCDAITRLDAVIASGESDEMEHMPQADRDAMMAVIRGVCEKKDRESVEAFIDFGIDVQSRTCLVSTSKWTGRFSKNDEKTWVRTDKDGPVGDGCGGLYLDRLELSEEGRFWNLIRLAVASNPKGTFTTGEQCSEVYTGEETAYSWQGGDLPGNCDYIRLSILN